MKKLLTLLLILWHANAVGSNLEPERSPWLTVPVLTSDPKIGTSGGGLAGYLHQFDANSPTSLFGISGVYSNTDSYTLGLFAKTYFGDDRHRLTGALATGEIRNDYDDFLGTGLPVQTTDDLRLGAVRYLHRIDGNWFLGAQFIATNYTIIGGNVLTEKILNLLGLTGFDSNGIGITLQHDSRENQESPNSGQFFELSSMAYRESLGGDENFNTIRGKFVQYLPHGDNHVMAVRAQGRWTSDDAPRSAFSTVDLRGYVRGNYLAPNSTLLEVEERFHLNKRWSLAGFLSVACLYDRLKDCKGNDNLYPAAGGGVIYTIKPKEKMVMRMDAAFGKGDNTGFYLRFGHPF